NGISVAVGTFQNGVVPEVVVGAGAGGGGRVEVYSQFGSLQIPAYVQESGSNAAVHVAAKTLSFSNYYDVVTGQGSGGSLHLRRYNIYSERLEDVFESEADFRHGFFVA